MYTSLIAPARSGLRLLSGVTRLIRRNEPETAETGEDDPLPDPIYPLMKKVAEEPPARPRRPLIKLPLLEEPNDEKAKIDEMAPDRGTVAEEAAKPAPRALAIDDGFCVLDAQDRTVPQAEIDDFDIAEDILLVTVLDDSSTCDTVDLTFDAQRKAVRATHDGHAIALLLGLTTADIPYIQTAVVMEQEWEAPATGAEQIAA